MKNSILYLYSNMDKSSQILLFLIVLVILMLISIFIINIITKKKNENITGLSRKSKLSTKSDIKPTVNMSKKNNISSINNSKKNIQVNQKNVKDEILKMIDENEEPRHAKIENKISETVKPVEEVVKVEKRTSIDDIAELLQNTQMNKPIDLTKFEEDQEENAIISYDELVKRAGAKKIIYKCEDKKDLLEEKTTNIKSESKEKQEEKKFKASQVISPIFGIQKETEEKDEVLESFIDLEDFNNEQIKNNEETDSEFLNNLKKFRSTLE